MADPEILKAALRELTSKGFSGMAVSRVAAAARVTKPTVYLRFTSKRALAVAAVASLREPRGLPAPVGDRVRDLQSLLRYLVSEHVEEGGFALIGSVLSAERDFPELAVQLRTAFIRPRLALLEAALAAAGMAADDVGAAAELAIGELYAALVVRGRVPTTWPRSMATKLVRH